MAQGICTYCLAVEALTDDHIPPACLFGTPRPPGLITVPSCPTCNQLGSKDDEYFKLVLAVRRDISKHPVIERIRPGALRSLERSEAHWFARAFISTFRVARFPGSQGIPEKRLTYDVDLDRLYRVISRTTQGLYFHAVGKPVDRACSVYAVGDEQILALGDDSVARIRQEFAGAPTHNFGEGVFTVQGLRNQEDQRESLWLMLFYGRVPFLSATFLDNRDLSQQTV